MRGKVFTFNKIIGTLKINLFSGNWAKCVFDLVTRKTTFFSFSPYLAFKQTKEQILFQVQPFKNGLKKFRLSILAHITVPSSSKIPPPNYGWDYRIGATLVPGHS